MGLTVDEAGDTLADGGVLTEGYLQIEPVRAIRCIEPAVPVILEFDGKTGGIGPARCDTPVPETPQLGVGSIFVVSSKDPSISPLPEGTATE